MLSRVILTSLLVGWCHPAAGGDPPPPKPAEPTEGDGAEAERTFLRVGDPAPAIDVAHWLLGAEVEEAKPGVVHVIEFWATWCVPCRESLPTLAELTRTYPDETVRVLAVSDEKPQTVVRFLLEEAPAEFRRVRVGADPDRSTHREYMSAAALGRVPVAFVVGRDGRVDWIGHPAEGLPEVVKRVVEGTWDREAFAREFDERMEEARARFRAMRAAKRAYARKDWPTLMRLFDEAIEREPENPFPAVQKFQIMIGEMNDPEAGYAFGETLLPKIWDDARLLNMVAWYVADYERVGTRDLEFAARAAERACELTEAKDPYILDTVARVCFERGRVEEALAWQRQAIEHLKPDDPLARPIRKALRRYEEAAKAGEGTPPPTGDATEERGSNADEDERDDRDHDDDDRGGEG